MLRYNYRMPILKHPDRNIVDLFSRGSTDTPFVRVLHEGTPNPSLIWGRVTTPPPNTSAGVFRLAIDTRQTNTGLNGTSADFIVPTGGAAPFDWRIDWGDGTMSTHSGTGANAAVGIAKTYATAGPYTITITPNGSTDRWLGAYGFGSGTGAGTAQALINRNKVVACPSTITPLMVATSTDVAAGTVGNLVCALWFDRCAGSGFHVHANFGFSGEWSQINRVGNSFCSSLFNGCTGIILYRSTDNGGE